MVGVEVYYALARHLRDTPFGQSGQIELPTDDPEELVNGAWLLIQSLASAVAYGADEDIQNVGGAMCELDIESLGRRPSLRLIRGE